MDGNMQLLGGVLCKYIEEQQCIWTFLLTISATGVAREINFLITGARLSHLYRHIAFLTQKPKATYTLYKLVKARVCIHKIEGISIPAVYLFLEGLFRGNGTK